VAIRRLARAADVLLVAGLPFEATLAVAGSIRPAVVVRIPGDLVWERAHLDRRTTKGVEEFQEDPGSVRDSALHAVQAWIVRHADAVITPSQYLARIVAGWSVPAERLFVIPNAYYFAAIRSSHENPRVDLVTAGRLIPLKRVDALIRMSAEHGWTLDVIGDGPERNSLERLTAELGAVGVRFRGVLPAHEVPAAIARGKVFVLNSCVETFSHVLLEAMATAVPVVARAVGGIPEVVENGVQGWLVPVDDDGAFIAAISELLTNPEKRGQMGEAGKERVRSSFSLAAMAKRTEEVLAWAAESRAH
jgi:glycosyltransferase involved in cell wall biosynthesis